MTDEYNKHVFLDLETTGLSAAKETIIEIAAIVVDSELNEVDKFTSIVVPPTYYLNTMNDFVRNMHTKNGLLAEIERVPEADKQFYSVEYISEAFLKFLAKNNCKPGQIVLIGRQVGRFDLRFLQTHMPAVAWVMSHRCMELGDIVRFHKEFCGIEVQSAKKESNHRALDDCLGDLVDLRAIRDHLKHLKNHENGTVVTQPVT